MRKLINYGIVILIIVFGSYLGGVVYEFIANALLNAELANSVSLKRFMEIQDLKVSIMIYRAYLQSIFMTIGMIIVAGLHWYIITKRSINKREV